MKRLLKYIFCVLICSFTIDSYATNNLVKLEAKPLGKDIIFVVYHQKNHIVQLNYKNGTVYAIFNIPVDYQVINPGQFKKYASKLQSGKKRQVVSFNISKDLVYKSLIHGEKLEAIKFVSIAKDEAPQENLTKISAANNNPDGIIYSKDKNTHALQFNVQDSNTKAAVFFRGKHLWVVFDKKELFTAIKDQSIFQDFSIVPSSKGTAMRMKIAADYTNLVAEKNNTGWKIKISKDKIDKTKAQVILPNKLKNQQGVSIDGDFSEHELISIEDPEVGDKLVVVPLIEANNIIVSDIDSVGFQILKSAQGVPILVKSDEVSVDKYEDALKIISGSEDSGFDSTSSSLFSSSLEDYLRIASLLPSDKIFKNLDFNDTKSKLIADAATTQDKKAAFNKNLELAKFYFTHELYHEALNALNYIESSSPEDFESNLEARFLTAVSYSIIARYDTAKEYYDALLGYHDIKLFPEIVMWNNYNNYSLGTSPDIIGFEENALKSLKSYSEDKYWMIALAEIDLAINANDLKSAEKLFKDAKIPNSTVYNNSLKYYKAHYYRKKGQHNLAKQFFQDIAEQSDDVFNSARAEFEMLKISIENKDISNTDAISKLNALQYKWRGDKLEYDILLYLAKMYRSVNDSINAIRTFNYIQDSFSNEISNFYITSEMAKIFNSIFLPSGHAEAMDDFTAVALFYEFKELNPIGETGDNVILSIAKRLVKLDLLENAAELLRHQIKYRLKNEKRVAIADNLAVILMMDKKPREAIFILDDTDSDNFNFEEHQHRVRLRARALVDMEKYADAIDLLKNDNSEDGVIVKKEAFFRNQQWDKYIEIIVPELDSILNSIETQKADGGARQDLLRLAISYYQIANLNDLAALSAKIGTNDQELKDTADLLLTSSGNIDYKNIDKSLNIDQMNDLLTKYKNQFIEQK